MRIANRNFSPTLLSVALTIAAVALFVRFAFWQLSRAAEQDELQAKFAAGQNIVSDRDFIGDQVFTNTFIHAFVATAQQGDPFIGE